MPNPVVTGAKSIFDKVAEEKMAAYGVAATVGATTVLPQEAQAEPTPDPLAEKINQAFGEGFTQDDIVNYLSEQYKDTMSVDQIKSKVTAVANPNRSGADTRAEIEAMNLADKYRNVHESYADFGKLALGIITDNPDMVASYNRDRRELAQFMAEELKTKHNINAFVNPDTGALQMQTEDGKVQDIDSGFINSITNSGGELAGALTGGYVGMKLAPMGPWGTGKIAGTVLGAAAGAAAGRGVDVLRNAAAVKDELDGAFVVQQMVDAGVANVVMDVLGGSVVKLTADSWKGIKAGYSYVVNGNTSGAFKALTETMGITKEEAFDMVTQWEKLNNAAAPGKTMEEKAIAVAATTQPKAEGITHAAINEDPQASARVVQAIDERAKGLIAAVDKARPEEAGQTLRTSLDAYQKDVKDFYGAVKQEATNIIDHTDYRFNYNKIALEPVLNRIGETMDNPQIKERFKAMMEKIGALSKTRTFSDLVEIRQTVNNFKYGTNITRYSDKAALDATLNKIDGEIGRVAKEYLPNGGKPWLANFKTAKEQYAKMVQLEENALYKVLTKPGVTEDTIRRAIPKYMTSLDGTFNVVLDKLPQSVRAKSEMAAVKYMTDKYTFGAAADLQAVHFPRLAEELKALPLQTPEAKALAGAAEEMSKVFKNDPSLAKLGGQFFVRENGNALTADITAKVKYAVVGAVWKHVTKLLPTQYGRNMSLITQTARLLENPMKATTVDALLKQFPGKSSEEVKSLVKDLQVQYTKAGLKPEETVKLYKVGSGKLNKSSGSMGTGVYMTERVANPAVTEQGKTIARYEVKRSQLATIDQISALVGKDITVADIRKMPGIQEQLTKQGFVGITVDGKTMLFDDSIVEHGISRKATKTWSDSQM